MRKEGQTIGYLRINEKIRIRSVRVIDSDGKQLGVLPTEEAIRVAREQGLDLVEVSPDATPPVCKVLDYGKYKYAEHKKMQHAKKHRVHIKEIRLRPLTDKHDLMVKVNHIKEMVQKGDKVMVTLIFRGREKAHKDIGYTMMENILKEIDDVAKLDSKISKMGSRLFMTVVPKKPGEKLPVKPAVPQPPAAAQ